MMQTADLRRRARTPPTSALHFCMGAAAVPLQMLGGGRHMRRFDRHQAADPCAELRAAVRVAP